MGWIPAPHLAGERPSYRQMYNKILSDYRQAPLSSASAVIMLVAPNVDALSASRMLAAMFKHDDIGYRIIPVSGRLGLENVNEDLVDNKELRNLILLGMGGTYDLPLAMWFGNFGLGVTVHVIDAARPQSLVALFLRGPYGDRIIIWDDGTCEQLIEEGKSYEAIEDEPAVDSDDEDLDNDPDRELDDGDEEDRSDAGDGDNNSSDILSPTSRKRRKGSGDTPRKRHRNEEEEEEKKLLSPEERERHQQRLDKYYTAGTSYGQGVALTIYILATELERVDNDLLWLAILGVTYQYVGYKISRETYDRYHSMFSDEVARLNPQPAQNEGVIAPSSINPDDNSVRSTEELRFMLWRHWTLYDAMYHSSYVAGKLGIWKERGRSRLTGLLAKMGLSINQAQQPYSHMDMDLKKSLVQKLEEIAPEYGLVELSYPSFMKYYGFHTQPLSASDAVEGISALLDVAEGVRMEIEIEGTKNGGEWFGAGRMWESTSLEKRNVTKKGEFNTSNTQVPLGGGGETQALDQSTPQGSDWWVKNFWAAYDSLSDVSALRESLSLAMAVHRAIVRTGTSIIDKHDIKATRNIQAVILTQGPDLALFVHSGMLTRLALWLIDALRDHMSATNNTARARKRGLPILLACLNEPKDCFTLVGVTASPNYDHVHRNKFSLSFHDAIQQCNVDVQFSSFDASVVEIEKQDLKVFLDAVCQL